MRSTNWTGAVILTAVVLLICELSYAHRALYALWPLHMLVSSAWRVAHAGLAALPLVTWVAPLAFVLAGILLWLEAARSRRQARAGTAKGKSHE